MNQEIYTMSGFTDPDEIKVSAELAVQGCLESFEYQVVGTETLDEIIVLAREDWEADAAWREMQRRHEGRPNDDRLAVDFLRHQRTGYDWHLQEIQNSLIEVEPPVDEDGDDPLEEFFDDLKNSAHQEVREKTLAVILDRHPELAAAVGHRRKSNYTMSGGQLFHVGQQRY